MTRKAYDRLISESLPARIGAAPFEVLNMGRENVLLKSYSEYDPIDVPLALLDVLGYFDGRPTEVILDSILAERGVSLEPALIRKMVDFGLLVEPDAGAA